MCKHNRYLNSMKTGPATLQVDQPRSMRSVESSGPCNNDIIAFDPFNMRHIDEAVSLVGEPFPIISWEYDDAPAVIQGPDHKSCRFSNSLKNHHFLLSPQARRLKRRRRGSARGYLVRCLEVPSLVLFDDSTVSDEREHDEENPTFVLKLNAASLFAMDVDTPDPMARSSLSQSSRSDRSDTS
ncbi:hypothetical protein IV203_000392 [Nitzschia inconspicua]|uniref:Uncharacterized protein n=1 Tax=Nitzschia inconspicua TaxID=303405 RepID=A0A9K3PQM6_9STRA|nr:hypothetical protein IV203_000392 [Nitzschia inconspicua]